MKKKDRTARAVEQLRKYCSKQTDATKCRFDLGTDDTHCDCELLKKVPEDWHGGKDNNEGATE